MPKHTGWLLVCAVHAGTAGLLPEVLQLGMNISQRTAVAGQLAKVFCAEQFVTPFAYGSSSLRSKRCRLRPKGPSRSDVFYRQKFHITLLIHRERHAATPARPQQGRRFCLFSICICAVAPTRMEQYERLYTCVGWCWRTVAYSPARARCRGARKAGDLGCCSGKVQQDPRGCHRGDRKHTHGLP